MSPGPRVPGPRATGGPGRSTSPARTARGEATRARIVEAAAELIHRHGVSGTSLDHVLERADAGKSQLYHYFEGKDELVRAVLELQARRDRELLAKHLPRLDDWDGLRAWLDDVIRVQRERNFVGGCAIGSLAAEMAERSGELRSEIDEIFLEKRAALAEALGAMRDRGALRAEADPDTLATFLVASLQGGLLLASVTKRDTQLVRVLDEAYEHLRSFAAE